MLLFLYFTLLIGLNCFDHIVEVSDSQINNLIQSHQQDFFLVIYNEQSKEKMSYLENDDKHSFLNNLNNMLSLLIESNVNLRKTYSCNTKFNHEIDLSLGSFFSASQNEEKLFFLYFDKTQFIEFKGSVIEVNIFELSDFVISKYHFEEKIQLDSHMKNLSDIEFKKKLSEEKCKEDSLSIVEASINVLKEKISGLNPRTTILEKNFKVKFNEVNKYREMNFSNINPLYIIYCLFGLLIVIAAYIVINKMKKKTKIEVNKRSII